MNIKHLQLILAGYSDQWINSQPPAERGALFSERADLEHQLAEKLAQHHRDRTDPMVAV